MRAESGGILQISLVTAAKAEALILGAALGDDYSAGLLRAASECAKRIRSAPKRKPMLCLCCPAEIRLLPSVAFVVAMPHTDQPHQALGAALCPRCAAKSDPLTEAVHALRAIWPDLRPFDLAPGTEVIQ